MTQIDDPQVQAVFDAYELQLRTRLAELRQLILSTAANTEGVGPIEETLKWGQPSYITSSGTTIRIDRDTSSNGDYALYVNCQTTLVDRWRELYPTLTYSGTRGIHFRLEDPLPQAEVAHCIAMALTYHLRKKTKGR